MSQQQQKPVVPQNQEPVWIKCRAAEHCDGNKAINTLIFKKTLLQGGGTTRRYRCLTCKGSFTVTV